MTIEKKRKKPLEIALVGDVDHWEADVIKDMIEARPKRECVFYIDSLGGSVYGALAVTTLIRMRELHCTGIVLGECSSASLLIFAACKKRLVTRYSTLLFHRMRWESEKRIPAHEASRWAKHFEVLENDIDDLQARLFGVADKQIRAWIEKGEYVSGQQVVDAGIAEMLEI